MAALSIMTDLSPRWIKQGGHWVENSSSSSSSRSPSHESMDNRSSLTFDPDVLVNILTFLKKMDSKMELQAKRLGILEITGSPDSSSSGDTTVLNDSPLSNRPSVRTTSSKQTAAAPEVVDGEEANEYARSIMKMKRFLYEAVSVAESDHPEEILVPEESARPDSRARGTWPDLLRPVTPDTDLYSVSMYSGDLLSGSKMSLGLSHHPERNSIPMPLPRSGRTPPSPPASASEAEDGEEDARSTVTNELAATRDGEKRAQGPAIAADNNDDAEPNNTGEINTAAADAASPPPERRLRRHISISITETKTSSPYIRVELAFYTLDGWKRCVLPKLKRGSRALWEGGQVRFCDVRRMTGRVVCQAQKGVVRTGRAVGRKWKEERAKEGIKVLKWRVAVSFRDVVRVESEG